MNYSLLLTLKRMMYSGDTIYKQLQNMIFRSSNSYMNKMFLEYKEISEVSLRKSQVHRLAKVPDLTEESHKNSMWKGCVRDPGMFK